MSPELKSLVLEMLKTSAGESDFASFEMAKTPLTASEYERMFTNWSGKWEDLNSRQLGWVSQRN